MPAIRQVLRKSLEDVMGRLQTAGETRVAPTLVIGLGGSGTWTARRLKRLMQIRYGTIPLVRFLLIDADQGAFASDPELSDVTDEEKVFLNIRNPEQILQDAREGIGESEKMRDRLPEDLDVSMLRDAEGAGTVRPRGWFAFFASFDTVRRGLESALNSVLAIQKELETRLGAQARNIQIRLVVN